MLLREHREEGIELITSGLELHAAVGWPQHTADWRTAVAALIGLDHPTGLAAAEAADEWIRSVGAMGLARLWADGLPTAPAAARRVG
jgi:hypothetical protein